MGATRVCVDLNKDDIRNVCHARRREMPLHRGLFGVRVVGLKEIIGYIRNLLGYTDDIWLDE